MGDSIMSGLTFSTDALAATPTTGATEYNGIAMYFTPTGTQRGIIPGQQLYILNSGVTGQNATGTQSVFGLANGVTLSNNTVYFIEAVYMMYKPSGTTSHNFLIGFGGTLTTNNIGILAYEFDGNATLGTLQHPTQTQQLYINNFSQQQISYTGMTAATQQVYVILKGYISVNTGGTLLPQYSLSAAPGTAYTTEPGSYFLIYPVGAAGANVSIGAWS